jgi:hypothetical protein
VAASCEYGGEPSDSGATDLVIRYVTFHHHHEHNQDLGLKICSFKVHCLSNLVTFTLHSFQSFCKGMLHVIHSLGMGP